MSPAVVELMEELVTDPRRQQAFRRSPQEYTADRGLSQAEQTALTSGDVKRIRAVLADHSSVKEAPSALLLVTTHPDDKS
ncbi:hypothetical protein ACFYO5_34840 [Streptomyces sp. NPDC006259]|uniref:hypothetical protein n=1 Tax=Streptomyces sp. NPDC006259 TaxID=3364740 RepID=UPI0036B6B4C6